MTIYAEDSSHSEYLSLGAKNTFLFSEQVFSCFSFTEASFLVSMKKLTIEWLKMFWLKFKDEINRCASDDTMDASSIDVHVYLKLQTPKLLASQCNQLQDLLTTTWSLTSCQQSAVDRNKQKQTFFLSTPSSKIVKANNNTEAKIEKRLKWP